MKISLSYRRNFLCVLVEHSESNGPHTAVLVREWYPVYRADEAEIRTLLGRPVTQVDSDEGIYIDEEGNVFRLAEGGKTAPIEIERTSGKRPGRFFTPPRLYPRRPGAAPPARAGASNRESAAARSCR